MAPPDLSTNEPFEADAYRRFRADGHVMATRGEYTFALVVGDDEVRRIARDWQTFTSDTPFEVPIPHEHDVRSVRQIPIELDPPTHRQYRSLVEERFSRESVESHAPVVAAVVRRALDRPDDADPIDVVRQVALPVVNSALAAALGLPSDHARRWLEWGTHVFKGPDGTRRRNEDLDRYLESIVDDALAGDGHGLVAELAEATVDGRRLRRDELLGVVNLMFAGGRDTVVDGIVNSFLAVAHIPASLPWIRANEANAKSAVEEVLRIQTPLGYIGRHATRATTAGGAATTEGELIALGFAAANRDPGVFDHPDTCRLDRRPNRHVAFGHGPHTCLGAQLARMEMRVTLRCLAEVADHVDVVGTPRRRHGDIGGERVLTGFDDVFVTLGRRAQRVRDASDSGRELR